MAELLWVARRAIAAAAAAPASWAVDPTAAVLIADFDARGRAQPRPERGPLAGAVVAFGLTEVETCALAVIAAVEVDPTIGALVAHLQGGDEPRPSVATLGELLDLDVLTACLPTRTLVGAGLIETVGDGPFAFRPVRCPSTVWSRLVGGGDLQVSEAVDAAHLVLADEVRTEAVMTAAWLATTHGLVVVWGRAGTGRQSLAQGILGLAAIPAIVIEAGALASSAGCRDLQRAARWLGAAPVVVGDDPPAPPIRDWLEHDGGPRVWIQRECPDWLTTTSARVPVRVVAVTDPAHDVRVELWRRALANAGWDLAASTLAERYRFGPGRIQRIVESARGARQAPEIAVRQAITATARPGIAVLAERLAPRPRDELIVNQAIAQEFELAIGWARSHHLWYRDWQLTSGIANARGLTTLFAGPPGTGKTLAAQVLAGAIDRDLYRVDLSQAVSKWLGETEKNLGRIFDEAHDAGAVLFFDEADALFARRTTVRDSHDRYANLETGYLLQRLESHAGVVVLATNRRQDLDSAFLRRFDVVVEFSQPDAEARVRLWQRHLPPAERCEPDLDVALLAQRFELTGAQIRNAVLSAIARVVLDGDGRTVLGLPHLVVGATRELTRAGRLVNPLEYCEWAPWVRAALNGAAIGSGRGDVTRASGDG